jgi:hypothetical protein
MTKVLNANFKDSHAGRVTGSTLPGGPEALGNVIIQRCKKQETCRSYPFIF